MNRRQNGLLDGLAESSSTEPLPETQAQQAYKFIEEMIVTGRFPPNSLITEKALNRDYGIGRTPIREALQRLALEGTISILPRAGAIVSSIDFANQMRMIEVRREIEKILAGRAARLVDEHSQVMFEELAQSFDLAGSLNDGKMFISTDSEFNALVVATAQNSYATYAIGPISAQTRRFWFLHFSKFGELAKVSDLHAKIARSIAAKDELGARINSDNLIEYVEWYTKRTLEAL